MPSKEELRPHNTDVEVQTELIQNLGEKNKAYHVLEKVEAGDVPKPQLDFVIKKEDYKGFSEAFSKAMYAKGFAEISAKEQNIILNVDLLLRHNGINTNQMHVGDAWHFDFAAQTFRFQGENGRAVSGKLERPEATAIQRQTHEKLGDLHTSATARQGVEDVAPVNPTVLDVATEPGGGSLTETFRAFYNSEMGSVKARQEWLKSDPQSVAGINKYLRQLLGDKATSQLLKEDGAGYRGTAEQNRAWMMYIRYDLMEIKDTQVEKEKEKALSKFKDDFTREFYKKLKDKLGPDTQYVKVDFDFKLSDFKDEDQDGRGTWDVVVGYKFVFIPPNASESGYSISGGVPRTSLEGTPTQVSDDGVIKIAHGILNTNEGVIDDQIQMAKERALEKEETERVYSQFGDYEKIDSRIRDVPKVMMENYFDHMESSISMTYGKNVWITWSVEGKGKEQKRVVTVEWREAYGKNIPDDSPLLKKKIVRAEIPFKFGSTWGGQADDLVRTLVTEFDAYQAEEKAKKQDGEPPLLPDEEPEEIVRPEAKEEAPEKQTFEQFKIALDAAFDAQLKVTFGDDAKYVAFDLKADAQAEYKSGQWYVNLPYILTRTDNGEHIENGYSMNFKGTKDDFRLDAQTIAQAIIGANQNTIPNYMTEGYIDGVLKAAEIKTEPIDAKEYKENLRHARQDLNAIIRKDPVLKEYYQAADFTYDKKEGRGEFMVKYTSVDAAEKRTTHTQRLWATVDKDRIAEIAARPSCVNLKPEWIAEFYTIKTVKEKVSALAEELKEKAGRGELVKASDLEV